MQKLKLTKIGSYNGIKKGQVVELEKEAAAFLLATHYFELADKDEAITGSFTETDAITSNEGKKIKKQKSRTAAKQTAKKLQAENKEDSSCI
ncbi:hypothetical protein [Bacillus chungangensis]|uniref:Uncharacterized protein n=1 Tax=Bacillus chungangensis TaxID=587633 RepID=A0ABT9WTU6_9BACI|nr:hypothetical protein [Bacillus chungangensis]MDQ0176721.1 hypothetical protein [Bacillus chungangensis]